MNRIRRLAAVARASLAGLRDNESRVGWTLFLAAVIGLIGAAIRMRVYAANRSLWWDEAMLAVNIVRRPLGGLFPPLDYGQVAPPGFLMLVKLTTSVLGNQDYVLRLVPLLAGLLAIPLTYVLAKRWSRGWGPLLSLGMFALTPTLIYYSSEFKQYSSDVLAALVLLLLGSRCVEEDSNPGRLLALGAAGVLISWMSHPALFVLGGILTTLGLSILLRRDWRRVGCFVGVCLAIAVNFGIIYFTSLRHWARDTAVIDFWAGSYAPPLSASAASWYLRAFAALTNPSGISAGIAASGLFIVGVVSVTLRRWQYMSLALAPTLLSLAASALRLYPFDGRFLLFSLPAILILESEGVERIREILMRLNRAAAILAATACAVVLLIQPLSTTYRWLRTPPVRDDIKPALAYIQAHDLETDLVYLYYPAIPQFEYYAPFYGLDRMQSVKGISSRSRPVAYLSDVDSLIGNPRVWFIFAHDYRHGRMDEQLYIVQHLDRIGTRTAEFYSAGATIFLYDLSHPPPSGG